MESGGSPPTERCASSTAPRITALMRTLGGVHNAGYEWLAGLFEGGYPVTVNIVTWSAPIAFPPRLKQLMPC
jgi:hypothetical protein